MSREVNCAECHMRVATDMPCPYCGKFNYSSDEPDDEVRGEEDDREAWPSFTVTAEDCRADSDQSDSSEGRPAPDGEIE